MSLQQPNNRWRAIRHELERAQQNATAHDDRRRAELYRQRAIDLAAGAARDEAADSGTRVVVVTAGENRYGIPLDRVAQVFAAPAITSVPGAPRWLSGVANMDGQIHSVIHLQKLLAGGDARRDGRATVLVLRVDGRCIGLEVDRIEQVQHVDIDRLAPMGAPGSDAAARMVRGISPDRLIVLNVEAVLALTAAAGESAAADTTSSLSLVPDNTPGPRTSGAASPCTSGSNQPCD